jgi:hypothetical protein
MAAHDDDTGDAWTWAAMEPEPTPLEKELFDRFAVELLVDGNPTAAALRCGFMDGFAEEYGKRFARKSYVQKKLRELREKLPERAAEKAYNTRVAMNTLREVATSPYQKGSARVAAALGLAKIEGLLDHDEDPNEVGVGGGVILVPAVASIEAWEAAAAASQDKLAEESRVE